MAADPSVSLLSSRPQPPAPVQSLGGWGRVGPAQSHVRRPLGAAVGRWGDLKASWGPPSPPITTAGNPSERATTHTCGQRLLRPPGCLTAFLCDRRAGRWVGGRPERPVVPAPQHMPHGCWWGQGVSLASLFLCVCVAFSVTPQPPPMAQSLGLRCSWGPAGSREPPRLGLPGPGACLPGPPGRRAM